MPAAPSAFSPTARKNPDQEVGRDSEYLDGLLRFWQGNYYVSLLCSPETPETRTALLALGRRLAQRLPQAGERPEALALLPEERLDRRQHPLFPPPCLAEHLCFSRGGKYPGHRPGQRSHPGQVRPGRGAAGRAAGAAIGTRRRPGAPSPISAGYSICRPTGERRSSWRTKNILRPALENGAVAAVWHGGGAAPGAGPARRRARPPFRPDKH